MAHIPQLWLDHFPASEWGRTFNAKDAGQLNRDLRDAYWTLRRDAHQAGHRAEVASAHRSPWQQFMLRVGRVPAGQEFNPAFRGDPPTATPGNSKHQKRAALDLDMNDAGYRWLFLHAQDYGLALTVPGERWHVEIIRLPRVPLIPYPGPSWDDPTEDDDMPLSDADINRVALVAAATVDRVLAKRFQALQTALGLPVIAGVDAILADDFAELRGLVAQVKDALDADHGPA